MVGRASPSEGTAFESRQADLGGWRSWEAVMEKGWEVRLERKAEDHPGVVQHRKVLRRARTGSS